jgi:uncharacterized membrane protein YbhN (UPF0104 family)
MALLMAMVPTLCSGVRLHWLSGGAMPLAQACSSSVRAAAFNLVVPARLGESDRVLALAKYTGKLRALALIALDNFAWLSIFGLCVAVFTPTLLAERLTIQTKWILHVLVVSALLGIVALVVFGDRHFKAGGRSRVLVLFVLAALSWCFEAVVVACLLRAYAIDIQASFAVVAAVTLGLTIPVPAGLGIWEFATQTTLALYGVDEARGFAVGVAYHALYCASVLVAWALMKVKKE